MGRTAIAYRDYYDIPRIFVAKRHRKLLLFDCLFDEDLDDYPDHFLVYELPSTLATPLAERSWIGLRDEGRYIGRVDVKDVRFPFEHGAPPGGLRHAPIRKHRTDPMGGFHMGWIDDEVFERLNLD